MARKAHHISYENIYLVFGAHLKIVMGKAQHLV
jgi:hypothetical protein